MQRLLCALGLWLCVMATTAAPPSDEATQPLPLDHLPALRGGYFPLLDTASGHAYHVYVRLPEGYDAAAGATWPVVYLLDGDSLFPLLAPTHLFLGHDEGLPEAIVVGIAYGSFDPPLNRRGDDFTADGPDTGPGQGGAGRFHRFLREQLLPQVEGRYRADPARRVLVGQSRGGYFVLWSALRDPDLFQGRIASNPAAGPARAQLFATPAAHRREDLAVVVVSGARDTAPRVQLAAQWAAAWAGRGDAPWDVDLVVLPEGTHAASIGEGYRRAMLRLWGTAPGPPAASAPPSTPAPGSASPPTRRRERKIAPRSCP